MTAPAGIHFKHNSGAFGKKYLPETLGSGCAFLDYDNDGWQDILLINSTKWPGQAGSKSYPALYHNNQNGTFTDVTKEAGLVVEMYGLGCAVADYDNDGFDDIYVTCLGPNHLFRNLGNGKFQDVTAKAGVGDPSCRLAAGKVTLPQHNTDVRNVEQTQRALRDGIEHRLGVVGRTGYDAQDITSSGLLV